MAHAFLRAPDLWVSQRCTKVPFPSRQMAMRRLRMSNRERPEVAHGEGRWNTYRCRICGAWHVGHLGFDKKFRPPR